MDTQQTDRIPLSDHREHAPEDIKEELRLAMKIVEQSPVILFRRVPFPKPRLEYVSQNIARFGYTAQEMLSGQVTFRDLVHRDDQERVHREVEGFAARNVGDYTQNYRMVTRDGHVRWVEDTTTTERGPDGSITYYQGTVVDVTERKLAEEKLQESEAKFRRIVETSAQGFLMTDNDQRIIDVNDAFCRMLGFSKGEILGKKPASLATDEFRKYLESNSRRLLGQKYRTFEGTFKAKDGRGVPVLIHANTLDDEKGAKLGHVGFIADLTEQKKSLVLAGEVQKSLLPKNPPKIAGLDIAGRSIPCDEIGGDYYDYLRPDRNSAHTAGVVAVAVGDIAGHGVDSALLMATARAVLRDRYSVSGNLTGIIKELNQTLLADFNPTSRFMTLFALEIDNEHGSLRWVRAGHDPALVYCPEGDRFFELGGSGMALGVMEEFEISENVSDRLSPGCVIALGTDGIWEAFDLFGKMFGKDRFKEVIRRSARKPAAVILKNVYDEVFRFTEGLKPQDDITLVIVKLEAQPG
jgi:sigma-B regulation protein RsbU (phosphoserine phosphatase)